MSTRSGHTAASLVKDVLGGGRVGWRRRVTENKGVARAGEGSELGGSFAVADPQQILWVVGGGKVVTEG